MTEEEGAGKATEAGKMPGNRRGLDTKEILQGSSQGNLCPGQMCAAQNAHWMCWEAVKIEVGKKWWDPSIQSPWAGEVWSGALAGKNHNEKKLQNSGNILQGFY